MNNTASTSLLASFATLKGLSDEKKYKSPYQLLQEFIRYIIVKDGLYSFSAIEMKCKLHAHFSFQIPEAVVKTAVKNIPGIELEKGIFVVSTVHVDEDPLFIEKKKEADEYCLHLLRDLSVFISSRSCETSVNEGILLKELVSFLVNDQLDSSSKYVDLIGEYILVNENNIRIQDGLDRIREGSILYIGLSHNINETGSVTKPINLYLCTEIMFSLVGYNGEVYKQLADDFYNQVRAANSGNTKKIFLLYFSETKKEIDAFFSTAEDVVERKRNQWLDKPAMKAITNGCSTATDVAIKQADFYSELKKMGIKEDPNNSYYGEELFASNLESFDYEDEEDKKSKKEYGIKLVSHINKLRNGKFFPNDLESEQLLVTNTKATLLISKEQVDRIKSENQLDNLSNFAVSLDRITNLLWYKLGFGFSQKGFPTSVNALLMARTVLSSSVARKAKQAFNDIKKEYDEGMVTSEQVAARILRLREKPQLPEELNSDNVSDSLDFSPESLSRFEEQLKDAKNTIDEKECTISTLMAEKEKVIAETSAAIALHKKTIETKNEENARLQHELDEYHRKDYEKAIRKERRKNILRFVWSITWKVLILASFATVAIILEHKYDCKIISYIIGCCEIIGAIATIIIAIKKDKHKYLGDNTVPKDTPINNPAREDQVA